MGRAGACREAGATTRTLCRLSTTRRRYTLGRRRVHVASVVRSRSMPRRPASARPGADRPQSWCLRAGGSERAATRSLLGSLMHSRAGRRVTREREQVDQTGFEMESATADIVGIDAQLLAEAHGREAVSRRGEGRAQEIPLVEGRPAVLVVAGQSLERRSAQQLGERPGEAALRAEQ